MKHLWTLVIVAGISFYVYPPDRQVRFHFMYLTEIRCSEERDRIAKMVEPLGYLVTNCGQPLDQESDRQSDLKASA